MTVAALFVERGGPYFSMAGVEPYDVKRDARTYQGPHPVVAHPPCGPWGKFKHVYKGDEHALAPLAVSIVRRFGGVLEHPEHSKLWSACSLPRPGHGIDLFGGFSIAVNQVEWGHCCVKPTWLYLVGVDRSQITAPPFPGRAPTHGIWIGDFERARHAGPRLLAASKEKRRRTPPPFAEWLVRIAATVTTKGINEMSKTKRTSTASSKPRRTDAREEQRAAKRAAKAAAKSAASVGHLDILDRPQIAPGAPVFVRVDVGEYQLAILNRIHAEYGPFIRPLKLDSHGRYDGTVGPEMQVQLEHIGRVFMERDWESTGVLGSETLGGFDARMMRGPATDELQRPRDQAQVEQGGETIHIRDLGDAVKVARIIMEDRAVTSTTMRELARYVLDINDNGLPVGGASDGTVDGIEAKIDAMMQERRTKAAVIIDSAPEAESNEPRKGDAIGIRIGRSGGWERVTVTMVHQGEVHFVGDDGNGGSRPLAKEGKQWKRIAPASAEFKAASATIGARPLVGVPAVGETISINVAGAWCAARVMAIDLERREVVAHCAELDTEIRRPTLDRDRTWRFLSKAEAARIDASSSNAAVGAEVERRGVEAQGERAMAKANGGKVAKASPVDQAVADGRMAVSKTPAETRIPNDGGDRPLTLNQRNQIEAKRLGIPLWKYVEQQRAEAEVPPTDAQLEEARARNARLLASMTGEPAPCPKCGRSHTANTCEVLPVRAVPDADELAVASDKELRAIGKKRGDAGTVVDDLADAPWAAPTLPPAPKPARRAPWEG